MTKLSVLMMVKNGTSTIERALAPLADIADEVCMHDTGSTDETVDFTNRLCGRLGIKFLCIRSSIEHSSDKFFIDEQKSLGESFVASWQDSFTSKPILSDWSWGFNEALSLCRAPYVLRLDADDIVLDPQNILLTLEMLNVRTEVDIVSCPYEIMNPITESPSWIYMRDRLWRRGNVKFEGVMHEKLVPKVDNWIMAVAGLRFRDMRDSIGDGVRVQGRDAKVLVREWSRRLEKGLDVNAEFRFTIGHELVSHDPKWAMNFLGDALYAAREGGGFKGFEAEILYHMGRACEALGERQKSDLLAGALVARAVVYYTESVDVHPSPNALLRRGLITNSVTDLREGQRLAKQMGNFNTDLKLLEEAKSRCATVV